VAELNEIHECGQPEGLGSEDVVLLRLQEYAAVLDTEGDRQVTTTKRERYLARRQSPKELTAAIVNARLEVNDWHTCSTPEELARWREAQQRLIDAAEAVGQASVHASRALMADTEGDRQEPAIGAVLLARVFAIVNETDPALASELFRAVMKPVQP
jgi:hypothetical protein